MSDVAEILLAQIWNSQWFIQPLRTADGALVRVVYPGLWSHGFGPDFRNAMLDVDGHLVQGDIEVDLDVAGWTQHGHDVNDAFDRVVLQVVARDADVPPVRRCDGGAVPRVVLTDFLPGSLDEFPDAGAVRPLGAIGFDTCAPVIADERPDLIRAVCEQAGDRRMQEKVSVISGEMAVGTPAQVLYTRLLDALGFSRNREPMVEIASRLSYEQLWLKLHDKMSDEGFWTAAGLLLGLGGFLPLSPGDAASAKLTAQQVGRIEKLWEREGKPWHGLDVSPGFWNLARLRPAAHPVRRLLAAAVIFAVAEMGLVEYLVGCLGQSRPRQALQRWLADENPWLGKAHAHEIIVNVIVPFALAYGDEAHQRAVADAGAQLWQELPAGRGNAITRKTLSQICGEAPVLITSARAEQGLIQINRQGCSQMRCFECPIAHLALVGEGQMTLNGRDCDFDHLTASG